MRRTWCLCFGVATISTALTGGCTTPTLFGPRPSAEPATGMTQSSVGSRPNADQGGTIGTTATDPYGNLPRQLPANTTTTGGVALASLLQAGKSVSNALKIQSKISPAVDPVMLDNQPANSAQVAAELHYRAGYFRETQNDFVKAAEHYRTVLQKMPNDVRALAGFGRVQDQLGNIVEAEEYLRLACELAPREAAPWNDLAQSYFRRKNLSAAITCQEQAVALQPTNPQYRSSFARILVDGGRSDEAVQQLAAVYGEAMAHFQVGCLLDEIRATDLARRHVEHSLTLNPGLAPARQMLDRWQVAAAGFRPNQGRRDIATRLPLP